MTDPVAGVEKWLDEQGYPLEYEAARILQKSGYRAWQGIHYRATEAGERKTREIDVVASEPPLEGVPRAIVELVVEAKHTHEPWLILTSQIQSDRAVVQEGWLLKSPQAEGPLHAMAQGEAVPFLLQLPPRHGFNAVQTIKTGDPQKSNPAYAALQAVVSASVARLKQWSRDLPAIVFPVIVLGGSLVQLGYGEDGGRILEPVLWQRIRWTGSTAVDHCRCGGCCSEGPLRNLGQAMPRQHSRDHGTANSVGYLRSSGGWPLVFSRRRKDRVPAPRLRPTPHLRSPRQLLLVVLGWPREGAEGESAAGAAVTSSAFVLSS